MQRCHRVALPHQCIPWEWAAWLGSSDASCFGCGRHSLLGLFHCACCMPGCLPQTVFLRNYTTEAAKSIPDNSLDFVYVDARWVLVLCCCGEQVVCLQARRLGRAAQQ